MEDRSVIQTTVSGQQAARTVPADRPVAAERVAVIDMLRGLALCGILLIHVATFARPGAPPGLGYMGTVLNELILAGLILFIEAKFFCLFALLFGVSFAVQRESADRRGLAFAPMFRRRLLILGLIGIAHILFVWEGDILLLYAAIGLLLIPLSEWPSERLARWAALLLGIPLLIVGVAFGGLLLARLHPEAAAWLRAAEAQFNGEFAATRAGVIARYASDAPLYAASGRVRSYVEGIPLLLVRAPAVLAMFLVGFMVGRHGILRDVERHLPLLRRGRAWGLAAGLVASLLVTVAYTLLPSFSALTALGFNQVFAGPVLAIGYAAAFVLFARLPIAQRLLAPLASYGRMALTVYLLQSIICGLLFYGFGLGLVLEVVPYEAMVLALVINALLIVASGAWLRRFRYGPVEWAWRSLTLGRAQPFLISAEATGGPRQGSPAESARTDARRRDTPLDGRRAPGQR
jgi:uncharacterized protein